MNLYHCSYNIVEDIFQTFPAAGYCHQRGSQGDASEPYRFQGIRVSGCFRMASCSQDFKNSNEFTIYLQSFSKLLTRIFCAICEAHSKFLLLLVSIAIATTAEAIAAIIPTSTAIPSSSSHLKYFSYS